MDQMSAPEQVGFPCVSPSGEIQSETDVTVEANDHEVPAALGWVSAAPCSGEGPGVVSDGFFAGLEDSVVTLDAGEPLRVHAPGFGAADVDAAWDEADGSEFIAEAAVVEPGTWEIVETPQTAGSYVLNLRFEYGEDQDAAFAVRVELQN